MKRREFITLLGCGPATWPIAARAQQSDRMRQIAVLMNNAEDDPEGQARAAAFRQGLQSLGWTDGKNLTHRLALDGGRYRAHSGGPDGTRGALARDHCCKRESDPFRGCAGDPLNPDHLRARN
jgi:hypothetical protein